MTRPTARAESVRGLLARALLALAVLSLVFASPRGAAAEFFEGRVVKVFDGDTIEVLVGHEQRRVRLSGIDTPERGQPWAEQAKRALSRRVFGKSVRVNDVGTDRYGRTVGEVYADNVCVGCELVREGHAWVYRKYTDDPVLYELEAQARAARRGLWGLPEAERVPPWEWRHASHEASDGDKAPAPSREGSGITRPARPDFACADKHFCREMASCAEALFYLEHCGLASLDGDGNGVPCASLCR